MNSKQRNLVIGGALLAGGVVGFLYIYNKNKETKAAVVPSKEISKELVIRILKELQREMFGVLTNISMISNQIKDESKGKLPVHEIKEFLLNYNPQTKNQIKQISDAIYEKYGLEEKDLKYACEVTYQDDKEIKTLINEAKNTFDKAFTGVPPDIKTEIPSFLTAELTLTLMQKIMKESLYKIQQFLKNLKEKGIHISYENPQVLMGLQDLRLDEIRNQILVEAGLDKYQDPPLKIFQYASQKYASEDPQSYNHKLMKLEMQNQNAMDALIKDPAGAGLNIEAIGAHLFKDTEDVTLASQLKKSRAHKAAMAAKKAQNEEADEEEEIKALSDNIRNLQHEVSFQLKNALEESGTFPKELVDSAVNTVFNVFTNFNHQNLNKSEVTEEIKKQEESENVVQENVTQENIPQENILVPQEENILVKEEEVHVESVIAPNGETETTIVETHNVEVKEVQDEEGNKNIETVTEDKIIVETEDAIQEVIVQETVIEKTEENNEIEEN